MVRVGRLPVMCRRMMQQRARGPLVVGVVGLSLVLAACSSNASTSGSTTTTAPTGAQVSVVSSPFGTVLVNSNGRALYAFTQDSATSSRCNGACATTWIPLTTRGKPRAGTGVDKALLASLARTDGSTQVVYGGHPLYTFSGDTSSGQFSGQGTSGQWYLVAASGQIVTGGVPSTTTTQPSTTTTTHPPATTTTTRPPPTTTTTTVAPTTTTTTVVPPPSTTTTSTP